MLEFNPLPLILSSLARARSTFNNNTKTYPIALLLVLILLFNSNVCHFVVSLSLTDNNKFHSFTHLFIHSFFENVLLTKKNQQFTHTLTHKLLRTVHQFKLERKTFYYKNKHEIKNRSLRHTTYINTSIKTVNINKSSVICWFWNSSVPVDNNCTILYYTKGHETKTITAWRS